MLIFLYCCLLVFLGYVSFCVPIGIIVFRKICVRSTYEKQSVVDTASHVKDERIMKPLLEAKERWEKAPFEQVETRISSFSGIGSFFSSLQSNNLLSGDLLLHPDFGINKTIAILVHGFTDSSAGMAYLAESYHEQNISTLSINLRAHGKSSGAYSGLGSYHTDGNDIAQWVKFVRNRYGKEVRIILHGVSMGGSSVIQAAYQYLLPVDLVVSDCTFSDYSANVKHLLQSFFPKNWFSSLIIAGIYCSTSLSNYFINGFLLGKNSPKKVLEGAKKKKFSLPLLIVHGGKDTLVKPLCAQKLYDTSNEPKELLIIKDAPHIGSWFYEKEKYMNAVSRYLQE